MGVGSVQHGILVGSLAEQGYEEPVCWAVHLGKVRTSWPWVCGSEMVAVSLSSADTLLLLLRGLFFLQSGSTLGFKKLKSMALYPEF